LFQRIKDAWDRPITGIPGAWIDVIERKPDDETWQTNLL